MQIEFWVEVYFETRRFRPLSLSPLSYTVFAPTIFNPCKSSSPLDWIKSRLVDLCATQIAVKFRTAPHYCKKICFPSGNILFFSLFSLSKNWMHNVVWGCAEILPKSLKNVLNVKSTRIILNFSNWVESVCDLGWRNQLNTLSGIVKQTKLFYLLFGLENMRNNLG